MKQKANKRLRKKSILKMGNKDTVLATVPIEIKLDNIDPNYLIISLLNRKEMSYREHTFLTCMKLLRIKFTNEERKLTIDLDENFNSYGEKRVDIE